MTRTARFLAVVALLTLGLGAFSSSAPADGGERRLGSGVDADKGCLRCHERIEDMHPEAELSCTDCHGGNGAGKVKEEAHVPRPRKRGEDERVAKLEEDLAWRRFKNPMDLRVVEKTCSECHDLDVHDLLTSLHGTTAGHLSDGYYEMGVFRDKGSRYSVFPPPKPTVEGGAVDELVQVPEFEERDGRDKLATHFGDLARKECMQCHLWSEGRAVRGRVGFDGDYRGEGCAACHVAYAIDGLSESRDPSIPRTEPGHPRKHTMVRHATTDTCSTCHYGDATIGLHFRGLAQLPPNVPGGPDIPGTTDRQLNRSFYLNDPEICPPDIHHEKGMHCVDCHTRADVMGDGKLHGQMEYAVEITCEACHGTFDEPTKLETERGTRLNHLFWDGDRVKMTSKVTGKEHVVPQVVHVIDSKHEDYNPDAKEAMTSAHGKLECYTCHASWNTNFLGFHFSRNESLTQLDLLSGKRTPGRVTTQEKVFATFKSFYAGLNEAGKVAPYLTGFSTMGSVWDEEGKLFIDQALPVTKKGLSGMTMVHHQLHSTRDTARSCVECHRSSATWGMGSVNFQLARQVVFIADRRGIEGVVLNRQEPARSVPLSRFIQPDVVSMALECDPLTGYAKQLFVAEGRRGIHVLDASDPRRLVRTDFHATVDPQEMEYRAGYLYVADGVGGLKIFDTRKGLELVGKALTFDAHDVFLQFPYAYVADGVGGLAIFDVRAPIAPKHVHQLDVNDEFTRPNGTVGVEVLFQYSRPTASGDTPLGLRTDARLVAAMIDRELGLFLYDVTEPTHPELLWPQVEGRSVSRNRNSPTYRGLVVRSQVDPGESQGGARTKENDYAYLLVERGDPAARRSIVQTVNISNPKRLGRYSDRPEAESGFETESLAAMDLYNPPFRQRILLAPGELGVFLTDVTTSSDPVSLGTLPGLQFAYAAVAESFPLDRMIDFDGERLKDVSHDSRWLYRSEIERILDVPIDELDVMLGMRPENFGATARAHLARLDADDSGFLDGEEFEAAGGASLDSNRDGRLTMRELARGAGLFGTSRPIDAPPMEITPESRVLMEGDLACLLDGVDPFDYDKNKDAELDRREFTRLVFEHLDLDGNKHLDADEASRYPGRLRQLRYGGSIAAEILREYERRDDGKITNKEFRVADADWAAIDKDGDDVIRLDQHLFEFARELHVQRFGQSEWPTRIRDVAPLPPGISIERVLATFDADGDEALSRKELKARPDLFEYLAYGGVESVERARLNERIEAVNRRQGYLSTPDEFLARWDLDGSGRIEEEELPDLAHLRLGTLEK